MNNNNHNGRENYKPEILVDTMEKRKDIFKLLGSRPGEMRLEDDICALLHLPSGLEELSRDSKKIWKYEPDWAHDAANKALAESESAVLMRIDHAKDQGYITPDLHINHKLSLARVMEAVQRKLKYWGKRAPKISAFSSFYETPDSAVVTQDDYASREPIRGS